MFAFVLAVYAGPQNAPIWNSRNSLPIYIKNRNILAAPTMRSQCHILQKSVRRL